MCHQMTNEKAYCRKEMLILVVLRIRKDEHWLVKIWNRKKPHEDEKEILSLWSCHLFAVQYCAHLRMQFKLIVHHRTPLQSFLRQAVDLGSSCIPQFSWLIINLCCEYKNTRIEVKCSSIKDQFRWEQVEILAVIWAVLSKLNCFAKLHRSWFWTSLKNRTSTEREKRCICGKEKSFKKIPELCILSSLELF